MLTFVKLPRSQWKQCPLVLSLFISLSLFFFLSVFHYCATLKIVIKCSHKCAASQFMLIFKSRYFLFFSNFVQLIVEFNLFLPVSVLVRHWRSATTKTELCFFGGACHAGCQSHSQTAWYDGDVMLKNAHTSAVLIGQGISLAHTSSIGCHLLRKKKKKNNERLRSVPQPLFKSPFWNNFAARHFCFLVVLIKWESLPLDWTLVCLMLTLSDCEIKVKGVGVMTLLFLIFWCLRG